MNAPTRNLHREHYESPSLTDVFGADYHFDFHAAHLSPVRRVALFAESFYPRYDGVSQHAYRTVRYLQQTGRDVLIFAPDDAPPQVGKSRVIQVSSIDLPKYPGLRIGLPSAEIGRQLAQFQPDLIHIFSPGTMSLSAISFARRHHVPTLANYESNLSQYMAYYGLPWLTKFMKFGQRLVHNHCDLTLVPVPSVLQQLQQAKFQRLACWTCGVDEQRFNPRHYSPEWRYRLLNGRAPSSLLCVYVGRLAAEKNISALLKVARLPGVALTIIGDGPDHHELEQQFSGTGTYFTGCLFGDDLARAYASADVFTFPSKTETFGLVTLEAMASGLPVVVSNEGGASNFVTHGETGFLCASPQAISTAVEQLRDNVSLRGTMARQAHIAAGNRCHSAIMVQLEDFYCQVQSRHSHGSDILQ